MFKNFLKLTAVCIFTSTVLPATAEAEQKKCRVDVFGKEKTFSLAKSKIAEKCKKGDVLVVLLLDEVRTPMLLMSKACDFSQAIVTSDKIKVARPNRVGTGQSFACVFSGFRDQR